MIGNQKSIQNLLFNYMKAQPEQLLRQLKLLQLQKKEIDLQITEKKMIL